MGGRHGGACLLQMDMERCERSVDEGSKRAFASAKAGGRAIGGDLTIVPAMTTRTWVRGEKVFDWSGFGQLELSLCRSFW